MINHFLTTKYRIVRSQNLSLYEVHYKPKYSFFWEDRMCDGSYYFKTYEKALEAAIYEEEWRIGINQYTSTNCYTSKQLLNHKTSDD